MPVRSPIARPDRGRTVACSADGDSASSFVPRISLQLAHSSRGRHPTGTELLGGKLPEPNPLPTNHLPIERVGEQR